MIFKPLLGLVVVGAYVLVVDFFVVACVVFALVVVTADDIHIWLIKLY